MKAFVKPNTKNLKMFLISVSMYGIALSIEDGLKFGVPENSRSCASLSVEKRKAPIVRMP